jgi:hypothetical protein
VNDLVSSRISPGPPAKIVVNSDRGFPTVCADPLAEAILEGGLALWAKLGVHKYWCLNYSATLTTNHTTNHLELVLSIDLSCFDLSTRLWFSTVPGPCAYECLPLVLVRPLKQ